MQRQLKILSTMNLLKWKWRIHYSRRFNEENKIKRFYKTVFLSEDEFTNITSFNYYFEIHIVMVLYLFVKRKFNDSFIRER